MSSIAADAGLFEAWELSALCAQVGPAVFFADEDGKRPTRRAKRVCGGCPVTDECLNRALQNPATEGIWGGTTERDRRDILQGELIV